MKEAHKNDIPWNKGLKLSEKHKANLRKPKSEEHKANLRKPKSEIGKLNIKNAHNTPEYKERASKVRKGIKLSEEQKAKMRKPKSAEHLAKLREIYKNKKGTKLSDDHKLKIAAGLKRYRDNQQKESN
jgi:hypothetical protein